MTIIGAIEHEGHVLRYDQADVESVDFSTHVDVQEVPCPGMPECACGSTTIHRMAGQQHLTVKVSFKPGKSATWEVKGG